MTTAHEWTRISRTVGPDVGHGEDCSPRTVVRAVKSLFVPTDSLFECCENT